MAADRFQRVLKWVRVYRYTKIFSVLIMSIAMFVCFYSFRPRTFKYFDGKKFHLKLE